MNRLSRVLRLIAEGKGLGLAERVLARLPGGKPLTSLPDVPDFPVAPPIISRARRRPLRVLVAGASLRLEGAPLSQFDLIAALTERGVIEPVVACIDDGPLREDYQNRGIQVRLGLPSLSDLYSGEDFTRAAQGLANELRADDIDLVLAVTLLTAPAVEAARLAGLPAVWNPRESVAPHLAFRPFGATVAERALACLRHPAAVVFVAEASRALWAEVDYGRFHVVANALPPERVAALAEGDRAADRARLGLAPREVMVLVPGTLCPRKGQRDLVAALARLSPEASSVLRVVMLGDGDGAYARALIQDQKRLPPGLLQIVPAVADIAPWYRAADVVALPSRAESAPRVVLEALSAGRPLLVSPVFGIAEQVPEGEGALYCPPGRPAEWARHLERLALSCDLRADLGARGRQRLREINNFSDMVDAYSTFMVAAARGDGRVRVRSQG